MFAKPALWKQGFFLPPEVQIFVNNHKTPTIQICCHSQTLGLWVMITLSNHWAFSSPGFLDMY